jgi:hypothetical protein
MMKSMGSGSVVLDNNESSAAVLFFGGGLDDLLKPVNKGREMWAYPGMGIPP